MRLIEVGRTVFAIAVMFGAVVLVSGDRAHATDEIGSYPLDGVPRTLEPGEALPCAPSSELVAYRGELVRYQRPVRIHRSFRPRLLEFERIVVDTAREIYGRAPRRLVHLGAHNCRRMRRYPDWVSEHALGNALDVAGFEFAPVGRGEALPDAAPRALRRGFSVRLETHWKAERGPGAVHSRFLRTLAQRVIDRPDIFRTVLGPAWPGHHNHFHLDCAPYRVVEVFEAP